MVKTSEYDSPRTKQRSLTSTLAFEEILAEQCESMMQETERVWTNEAVNATVVPEIYKKRNPLPCTVSELIDIVQDERGMSVDSQTARRWGSVYEGYFPARFSVMSFN